MTGPTTPPAPTAGSAGLLLRETRLVGVPAPVDLRIEAGRTTAIAPAGTLAPVRGEETVALGGRWVVPGLWDAHVHLVQQALAARRLDVSGASSAVETADLVAAHLVRASAESDGADSVDSGENPSTATVVGFGFRDATWPDLPTAALLDRAAGGRAVVLVSGDLHCGWFSTAALARFGLVADGTGLVREDEFLPIAGDLDDADDVLRDAWVRQATRAAARRGVVGVRDFEAEHPLSWARRASGGPIALRVRAGVWPQFLDETLQAGRRTGDALPSSPRDAVGQALLTAGPLKVITDGSLNTRTAYCHDPYPGTQDRGVLTYAAEELRDLMSRAHAGGMTSAIHAIGDDACGLALDAFEATGARGSIEHAQLLTSGDVPRFAALGVVASVQPAHLLDDREVAEELWPGRTERAYALASLLATSARLALGSDAPVAPLDPWLAMAAAVHRTGDDRPAWHGEQSIGATAALAASTDGHGTTPSVGDVADLAICDVDPLLADAAARVAGTLLAGVWTHRDGV